jgi:hypothetical protein
MSAGCHRMEGFNSGSKGLISSRTFATPHCHRNVQNLVHKWGWEVLAHVPYSPDLTPCDCWLCAHVKECLQGKQFES